MEYTKCRSCGGKIELAATKCPYCGIIGPVAGTETKARLSPNNIANMIMVGFAVAILLGLYACMHESDEEKQQKAEAAAARKTAGFHCLSGWDGSNQSTVGQVKNQLRDPSSFEHISTRITPIDDAGNHRLVMSYRAKNGFGALTTGVATASVRNASCEATVLSVD